MSSRLSVCQRTGMVIGPSSGTVPSCRATGHTSPAEALTAFGYVTMEFCGRGFPTFISIYGPLLKLLTLPSTKPCPLPALQIPPFCPETVFIKVCGFPILLRTSGT